MDAKQIQSLKKHSTELAQFVTRLTSFYEGIDKEIDAELKTLRGHLAGTPNFTLASVSISKTTQLLMNNQANVKKVSQTQVQKLQKDIKYLQQLEGAPPSIFTGATDMLIALNQPVGTLNSLHSLLGRAYDLYKKAIHSFFDEDVQDDASSLTNTTETQKLRKNIIEELSQLVENYSLSNPEDSNIASLRERIAMGLNDAELLHSCLVVIRLMVKDSMSEATATGRVIQHLEQSLEHIDESVTQSIEMSNQSFESQKLNRQKLTHVLSDMGETLEQSESLERLKTQAQKQIEKMSSTISEREEAEKKEQAGLMNLLDSMQSQLVNLQKQTHFYRRKLKQQRVSTYTDPLTKIPNRMAYNERSTKDWQQSQSSGSPLCIAIVDIDHFKRINDKYGHAAGDKTLQVIARHLKGQLESEQFIARWGGEEFIMLFPNSSLDAIKNRLNTIRDSLEKLPFKFKQERVTVTASIGATQCNKDESLEVAFERVDNFLYEAKNAGRNRVVAK